jgi:hypothetical protein
VLPQLAKNGGWLKLMGEAKVEQTKRQASTDLPVSVEQAEWRERKEKARNINRAAARKVVRAEVRTEKRRALFLGYDPKTNTARAQIIP